MAAIVEVQGAREMRRTLRRSGVDLKQFREVHRDVADVVRPAAAAAAPVRSGALKASVRAGATQRAAIIRAGRRSVPYAGPIHWGWPARNITAQPFLSDPARATEPRWIDIYNRRVDDLLGQVRGI